MLVIALRVCGKHWSLDIHYCNEYTIKNALAGYVIALFNIFYFSYIYLLAYGKQFNWGMSLFIMVKMSMVLVVICNSNQFSVQCFVQFG